MALPIDACHWDWGEINLQCEIQAAGCVRADPTAEGCQMAARLNTVDAITELKEIFSMDRCETLSPEKCQSSNNNCAEHLCECSSHLRVKIQWTDCPELRGTLQLCPVDVSLSLWKKEQQPQTEPFAYIDKSAM